jgi:menaquinol-cytochrome c reductase iron-sulfur subunit
MKMLNRRSFYTAIIYGLGSAISAASALPSAIYLLGGPRAPKGDDWIKAGELAQLQPGLPREITFERTRVDGWRKVREKAIAWVVRTDAHGVVAYSPQCTHLGCAYHWDEKQDRFICPCHASEFSIYGKVLAGPAARPLDRYDVRVENGKLLIGSQIRKA